jgi:hypothetical protein
MAGQKYMIVESGKKKLKEAKQSSAGAGDAGEIVALGADGLIDESMIPYLDVKNVVSSENLTAGDFVNLFDDTGTLKARKADNSNGRPAHGFVKDSVTAPAAVNIYETDSNANLSGLTIGARIYLGTTGGIIETPLDPTVVTGDIHQYLGVAISATEMLVEIQDCIEL